MAVVSVDVGRSNVTAVPAALVHSAVILLGQMISGASLSLTTIANAQVSLSFALSVAVHVTGVLPIGKVSPDVASHVTLTFGSHVSVAVGIANETGAPAALVLSTDISAGQLGVGDVVSSTIIENEHSDSLPAGSVVVQFTGVVPIENVPPDV